MGEEVELAANDLPKGTIEQLFPLVYQELRSIGRRERRRLGGGDTLPTTALVHELYLRLADNPAFASRSQFLSISAVAMRRILIDRVRAQLAAKRDGGERLDLDEIVDFTVEDEGTVLRVHEALEQLGGVRPVLVRVVECRYFAGYNDCETAEALGLSERTVQRHWATARAWLERELQS
jgi:RNA polymerase sigma factor (TIGR02999 family)